MLLQAQAAPEPDDIVVQAKRARCSIQLRGREMSNRELDAHIRDWAGGRSVRVSAPDTASYRCLSKIVFKLQDKGIQVVEFVDPGSAPR
jgi:biopolymer transport protein ExbD